MKDTYINYLSALRAFVQGSEPEKLDQTQLAQVLELAQINTTGGIVCYVYMHRPELIPPESRAFLRRQCLAEISLFGKRAELAKLLAAELDKNGMEFIVFKGLVVREYYPVPELRTFGDVDFIIQKADRQRSDELMRSLGYDRCEDWEPSFAYRKGQEHYELHSRVIGSDVSDKADFVGYFSDIWEHTMPSQVVELPHARELTPEFHFLYLLTHIAKHINASGAGIRMYLDLALFIRHFGAGLDWAWVAQELEKLCLTDFANMALSAVERWFGVESPLPLKPIPEEVAADFLEFTLAGGVYGYVGRDQGTVFLKQQNRNEESVSKFKTLLYHAFPPARVLENKYDYLHKHRWLLPVAWVQRLADSKDKWGEFAEKTKGVITADDEAVLKLKRIYKEIGL